MLQHERPCRRHVAFECSRSPKLIWMAESRPAVARALDLAPAEERPGPIGRVDPLETMTSSPSHRPAGPYRLMAQKGPTLGRASKFRPRIELGFRRAASHSRRLTRSPHQIGSADIQPYSRFRFGFHKWGFIGLRRSPSRARQLSQAGRARGLPGWQPDLRWRGLGG
jgi:hypothetical protein